MLTDEYLEQIEERAKARWEHDVLALITDLRAARAEVARLKRVEEALLLAGCVLESARLDHDEPDESWEADRRTVMAAAQEALNV